MVDIPTKIQQVLAALQIEDATPESVTNSIIAISRDPEPGQTGVSVSGGIDFLIVNLDGTPGTPHDLSFGLFVNGTEILSYDGTSPTWSNGWTGTVTFVDTPYQHWVVSAQQVSPPIFGSEEDVQVDLNFVGFGLAPFGLYEFGLPAGSEVDGVNISWSFKTEDITPPTVVSVTPIDQFTVRLKYSEPMATSGDGSALRIGAYTIERKNEDPVPGVNLEVVEVLAVDESNDEEFDLVMQWEQTPRCEYELTIDGTVTDRSGNALG